MPFVRSVIYIVCIFAWLDFASGIRTFAGSRASRPCQKELSSLGEPYLLIQRSVASRFSSFRNDDRIVLNGIREKLQKINSTEMTSDERAFLTEVRREFENKFQTASTSREGIRTLVERAITEELLKAPVLQSKIEAMEQADQEIPKVFMQTPVEARTTSSSPSETDVFLMYFNAFTGRPLDRKSSPVEEINVCKVPVAETRRSPAPTQAPTQNTGVKLSDWYQYFLKTVKP